MATSGGPRQPPPPRPKACAVHDETIGTGDYSGPEGARLALRRSEVETAILETARGGLLRRGPRGGARRRRGRHQRGGGSPRRVRRAGPEAAGGDQAAGGQVDRRRRTRGVNADDPVLVEATAAVRAPIAWFSLDPANPRRDRRRRPAAVLDRDSVVLLGGGEPQIIGRVGRLADHRRRRRALQRRQRARRGGRRRGSGHPARGRAGHAAAVRAATRPTIRDGPTSTSWAESGSWSTTPTTRTAWRRWRRRSETVPSTRRLVMLGQAGDRDDAAIRELARAALALRPDRVIVKEMDALPPRPSARARCRDSWRTSSGERDCRRTASPRPAASWPAPGMRWSGRGRAICWSWRCTRIGERSRRCSSSCASAAGRAGQALTPVSAAQGA